MTARRPIVRIDGRNRQLPAGDSIDGMPATAMQTQVLVATSIGQTVWPVSGGYTPNLITLSRNGSDQTPGSGQDYTATDGLNITTAIPALAVGEELLLRKWASITLTDALSTTGQAYDSARLNGQLPAFYATASSVAVTTQRMQMQEQRASGTVGGSSAAGYNVRQLNTVISNSIAGASLNTTTGEFTLPAGTFEIDASSCVAANSSAAVTARALLRTSGGASTLGGGDNVYVAPSVQVPALLKYVFTLAAPTVLQLANYMSIATAVGGLGNTVTIAGLPEIYSNVIIRRLA